MSLPTQSIFPRGSPSQPSSNISFLKTDCRELIGNKANCVCICLECIHPYAHPEDRFNIRLCRTALKNLKSCATQLLLQQKGIKIKVFKRLNVQIKVTPNVIRNRIIHNFYVSTRILSHTSGKLSVKLSKCNAYISDHLLSHEQLLFCSIVLKEKLLPSKL